MFAWEGEKPAPTAAQTEYSIHQQHKAILHRQTSYVMELRIQFYLQFTSNWKFTLPVDANEISNFLCIQI